MSLDKDYIKLLSSIHPTGKAFSYQLNWIADLSKFKLAPKARQIGITTTQAIDSFLHCLLWKESTAEPLPPIIVFCSPSQRQSERMMHYVQRAKDRFERLNETCIRFKKEKEDRITFQNFSELWSLPNNPRTIEGIDASCGVIDELGNFEGREDEQVYSAMMGSTAAKHGGLILFGKPHGRRGLFWKLYDPYGEFSRHYSIHKLDWHKRANEDEGYKNAVLEHKSRLSAIQFSENYEAEFVDESVLVFPYELLNKQKSNHKVYTLDDEYSKALPVYIGIDFGRKESETAITCVEKSKDNLNVIFHQVSTEKFDKQVNWIIKVVEHFKPVCVNVDKTGQGIPILDYLDAKFGSLIQGIHFNPGTKDKLVLNTKHLLENGSLSIPDSDDYKDLYEQIHGIEKLVSPETGNVKYSGKRTETGWLDDRAWSFFLSVYDLKQDHWNFTSISSESKQSLSLYDAWKKGEDV